MGGPFQRPDDVGTEFTAIVRTFTVDSETTAANPEQLQTRVASRLAAKLAHCATLPRVTQLTLIRLLCQRHTENYRELLTTVVALKTL